MTRDRSEAMVSWKDTSCWQGNRLTESEAAEKDETQAEEEKCDVRLSVLADGGEEGGASGCLPDLDELRIHINQLSLRRSRMAVAICEVKVCRVRIGVVW